MNRVILIFSIVTIGLGWTFPLQAQVILPLYDQPSDFPVAGDPGVWASQNDTNTMGGFGNFATAYDNFSIAGGGQVNYLTWQGGYFLPAVQGPIDKFTVTFYDDAGGEPGSVLLSNMVIGTAMETLVGVEPGTGDDGNLVYNYSGILQTSFIADPGTTYWLSIVPDLYFEQDEMAAFIPGIWGWHTGTGGDGGLIQDFDDDFNGSIDTATERFAEPFDLAFSLNQILIPEPVSAMAWFVAMMVGAAFHNRRSRRNSGRLEAV
ncbi:MAG: hypothetical protein KDA42_08980 [Planctomycetales bacterium]|nr:hypothetical protein [Planctomycetales bacterium]